MPSNKKLLQAAAGNAGGDPLYVEDVFSTYLYDGTGAAHTITNGIDLDGEGGLAWFKNRGIGNHFLYDTARGAGNSLVTSTTTAQGANTGLTAFGSTGFTLGNPSLTNGVGNDYASWTFRKAEKFFDVVTWTGTGGARTLSHNLGSTPSVIIVKSTTNSAFWCVYHSSLGATKYLQLSSTVAAATASTIWNDTAPTSTEFTVGAYINQSQTYVAYLFASDAGGFGDDGSENIIKCGSYTGTGGAGTPPVINLGFEPQWLLVKNTSADGNWMLMDTMRGWGAEGSDSGPKELRPNTSEAEFNWGQYGYDLWTVNPTGFTVGPTDLFNANNTTGATYIYIAIRRPMKTPESGTEVFDIVTRTATNPNLFATALSYVDVAFNRNLGTAQTQVTSRLIGGSYMHTASTAAEATPAAGQIEYDYNYKINPYWWGLSAEVDWMFKRATGFMDVVAYSGDGTAGTAQAHNLGVVPEMMIGKNRSNSSNWMVYHTGATYTAGAGLKLNTTAAGVSNTYDFGDSSGGAQRPDASSVYLGGNVNSTNDNYIIYLFATLAGVSKVGSYTGTGADLNIDCGFSAGARFILIKRTDSTGGWHVWDSSRGISASTDPYLLLNTTAAEVTNTDYIDPLASGFTVTSSASSTVNVSSGTYIFLAIA